MPPTPRPPLFPCAEPDCQAVLFAGVPGLRCAMHRRGYSDRLERVEASVSAERSALAAYPEGWLR